MEDHHVDRPDVEARQRVKLTGTNRSFGLIALMANAGQRTENRRQRTDSPVSVTSVPQPSTTSFASRKTEVGKQTTDIHPSSVLRRLSSNIRPLPAWWLLQGGSTRSHPELGRQTPSRQWYYVSRPGRVGRRQACKGRKDSEQSTVNSEQKSPTLRSLFTVHCHRRGVEQPGSSSGS